MLIVMGFKLYDVLIYISLEKIDQKKHTISITIIYL